MSLAAAGVLSFKYFSDMVRLTGPQKRYMDELMAAERTADEGKIDLGRQVHVLIAEGFTKEHSLSDQVAQKVRTMSILVAGLTTAGVMMKMIFSIMPSALQSWFLQNYAPAFLRAKSETRDWCAEALGLLQCGTIPYVFTSDEYQLRIKNMLLGSSKIIMDERILDATSRARFNYLNAKLTQLSMNLAQFNGMGSKRTRPFAVHVAGSPGCGKSLFMPTLLKDCFGLTEADLWTRELNTPFWNGYINQRCVFIDEFLCGSTSKRDEVGLEYLQLVSDSSYCPNMASIDNPMVGVKGTPAKPELVLTANNTPFDVVSSLDSLALQRRRSVVVRMRIKKQGIKMYDSANVDLRALTPEQLRNVAWAE